MTFSIVAWDPLPHGGPEWGVAVASKFLAVGSAVPWAQANAGALATQAFANLAYGPDGLARLARGQAAARVVSELTAADEGRDHRQLGVVDARGGAHTFTGAECMEWAGGVAGDGFCCQGNILAGPEVIERMADAFRSSDGALAHRLLRALKAGDEAGGDRRGKQAAALYVVREGGGYGGGIDRAVDLRVDDHPEPCDELMRLMDLHDLYFPPKETLEFVDIDESLANELRALLAGRGFTVSTSGPYDRSLRDALFEYVGIENLEERWTEGPSIERRVLEHLRNRPL